MSRDAPPLALILDRATVDERYRVAMTGAASLLRYKEDFHRIEKLPNIDARMRERAYAAEGRFRVLMKTGLDSANDLRDSGAPATAVRHPPSRHGRRHQTDELAGSIRRVMSSLQVKYPGVDHSPLEEAARAIDRLSLQLTLTQAGGTLHFVDGNGVQQEMSFRNDSRPGDLGRVSSSDLFQSSSRMVPIRPTGVFGADDCHRASSRATTIAAPPVAVYDAFVGSLAAGCELMYRHAREVDELGPAFVRGSGPAAAVVAVILVAAGVICLVAGLTLEILCIDPGNQMDSGTCDLGGYLILIGTIIGAIGLILSGVPINFANSDPTKWSDPELGSQSVVPVNNQGLI